MLKTLREPTIENYCKNIEILATKAIQYTLNCQAYNCCQCQVYNFKQDIPNWKGLNLI